MKPKKALKKINEALSESITDVVLLGQNKGGQFIEMNIGDVETSTNLLMNYLEDNQDVKDCLLKNMLLHSMMKKAISEAEGNNEQH